MAIVIWLDPIPLSEPPSGGVQGLRTLAPNGEFVEPAQADATCPVLSQKIFRFWRRANHFYNSRVLLLEGAFRDRHERGAECGGRGCAQGRTALKRTAKSCGPDASTLGSSFADIRKATVTKKPIAGESTK